MTERPPDRLRLREATAADLAAAAGWVGSAAECERWAGPAVSFGAGPETLAEQTEFAAAVDLALDDDHGLIAFGQVLARDARRAHLARVIVRPDARGRGAGRTLVDALVARAFADGAERVTLNVYRGNEAAVALYAAAGFRPMEPRDATPGGADVRALPGIAVMEFRAADQTTWHGDDARPASRGDAGREPG